MRLRQLIQDKFVPGIIADDVTEVSSENAFCGIERPMDKV
jgi:hypothetical protein